MIGTLVLALAAEPEPRLLPPLVHTLALFATLRGTEAIIWPEPFARDRRWQGTFTKPPLFDRSRAFFEWDGDSWTINSVGHATMGSELYLRARLCGFGALGSFAWTAGATALWEYGFEGNAVRPSALDLVWTPISGLAFGELRFRLFDASGGITDRAMRSFVRSVVDPFGEIDHAITHHACGR